MAEPKCKRCQRGEPHDFKHGRSGYSYHACRCELCRTYMTVRRQGWRACRQCSDGVAHAFAHGRNGYDYHGCRCDECLSAMSARKRRRYNQNPELVLSACHRYYIRNRSKVSERVWKWQQDNSEHIRDQKAARYRANRRRVLDKCAEYRSSQSGLETQRRQADKRNRIPTPSHGRPWTSGEKELAIRTDLSVIEIAYMTGRSYQAITAQRVKLRRESAA